MRDNVLHLMNGQSGYFFCRTKKPNILSPNVRAIKQPYYGQDVTTIVCDHCKPFYEKWKKIK